MSKDAYVQPIITVFDEEDILAIEALASCSQGSSGTCGGKCHKGSS